MFNLFCSFLFIILRLDFLCFVNATKVVFEEEEGLH